MNKQSQIVYNSLLNDNKLLPLSSFKSQKFSKYNLFPHAQSLPSFFDNNLKSDGRVVKYLKGPEGPLRAFYYQLFKLGFQIENQSTDYASLIKNILFDPNLVSYSTSPMSGKQYNISQYQRIIGQFMKIMESQVIPNAELTFSQYPIIDQAMLTILQLIIQKSQLEPSRKIENLNQLLERLCQIFAITLEIYDNCFSFQQSDVFLYVQSQNSYYMAFLSQMAQVQSFEKTSQSPLEVQYKQQLSSLSYGDQKEEARQANAYKDMRLSAGNKGTRARIINSKSPRERESKNNNFGSNSFGVYTNNKYHNEYNDYQLNQQNASRSYKSYQQHQNNYHKNVFQSSLSNPAKIKINDQIEDKVRQTPSDKNSSPNVSPQGSGITEKNQGISSQKQYSAQANGSGSNKKSQQNSLFKTGEQHAQDFSIQNRHQQLNNYLYSHEYVVNQAKQNKEYYQQNKYSKLDPVLDNVQTFKSISDGAHQNLQFLKNIPDYSSRVEYRAQDFMTNNKIQSLDPKLFKKAQVTLKDKVFQYQFKSHKYPLSNEKQTAISLSNNLQIKSAKQNPDPKINQISGLSVINTSDTLNTFRNQKQKLNNVESFQTFQNVRSISKFENKYNNYQNFTINLKIQSNINLDVGFYNPKANNQTKVLQSQINQQKMNLQAQLSKKLENSKDQTLGTYYREFSDTKVMQAMIEPYSSHVRRTRQKFKGIRSKNFRGFF